MQRIVLKRDVLRQQQREVFALALAELDQEEIAGFGGLGDHAVTQRYRERLVGKRSKLAAIRRDHGKFHFIKSVQTVAGVGLLGLAVGLTDQLISDRRRLDRLQLNMQLSISREHAAQLDLDPRGAVFVGFGVRVQGALRHRQLHERQAVGILEKNVAAVIRRVNEGDRLLAQLAVLERVESEQLTVRQFGQLREDGA